MHPHSEDVPVKYRFLLDWYEHDYTKRNGKMGGSLPRGGSVRDLLRFAGSISKSDLAKMKAVIEEDCERIDADAWRVSSRH